MWIIPISTEGILVIRLLWRGQKVIIHFRFESRTWGLSFLVLKHWNMIYNGLNTISGDSTHDLRR